MMTPIWISADLEGGIILVRYRRLAEGECIGRDDYIAPGVTAGMDTAGNIVSIELLTVAPVALAAAAAYAHAHALAFPRDLSHLLEAA